MSLKWICVVFLHVVSAWAGDKTKSECSRKELERQDCRLMAANFNFRILNATVAGSDGSWHSVSPMPLSGEGVTWEKVRFDMMSQRPILQFWLWDKGGGESEVQSLHWYVADAEHQTLSVLAEGVVRKRRLKPPLVQEVPPPAAAAKPSATKPAPKPVYLYDAMEAHGVKASKDGALEWSLGSQKKRLEKGHH